MNILSELTRQIILASKSIEIKPKIQEVIMAPSKVMPPQPLISEQMTFIPSLLMPGLQIPPKTSLESITNSTLISEKEFGKVSELISDISTEMIICDGPMRSIKLRKGGKIEQTNVILDREEIDSIINDFSKKSGVKLSSVFRSKIENLSILALISPMESRFMLTIDRTINQN